jgi:Family of unknown function (DUF6941)
MHVKLALVADAANVSREGKLNILGAFDTIYVRELPTTHPFMQLVIRLEADAEEVGRTCQVDVELVAPGGKVPIHVPARVTVQARESGGAAGIDHVIALANVGLETTGRHFFRVTVDGEVEALVPLHVDRLRARH